MQLGALHADGEPTKAYVDGAALTDGRLSLRWLAVRRRHVALQLEVHGRAPLATVDGPVGQAAGGGLALRDQLDGGAPIPRPPVPPGAALRVVGHGPGGLQRAQRVALALGAQGFQVHVARAERAEPRTVAGASPAADRVAVWRAE